jgi:CelD/BcsL family acetyltransferase involved in cellulose biosynthesis
VEDDRAFVAAYRLGETVALMGEADLTDYHAPRGDGVADLVARFAAAQPAGTRFAFDSLPEEAAAPLRTGLAAGGFAASLREHTVAAVLDLPASYDAYLEQIGSKQRHEVRRKRRRFEDLLGPASLQRDPAAFGRFVAMHRAAAGDKGSFMTEAMEGFFSDLLGIEGAVLDVVLGGDGQPVAAAFGFEDRDAYYLYNSAFDPGAGKASPGVVLVDLLVRRCVEAGRTRFDFLKGDETYKFRLGARARPLFLLEAVL